MTAPDSSSDSIVSLENATLEPSRWADLVDVKLNDLIEQSKTFERERLKIETLREQLSHAIETAELRLNATTSDAGLSRLNELETQLVRANQENVRLSTLLLHTREEYQSLINFIESEPRVSSLTKCSIDSRLSENLESDLLREIEQLKDQLQFLQSELAEARVPMTDACSNDSELRIQIEKLRSQLLEARHEAVESRLQNGELSSSLAKFKGPTEVQRTEAMSWEQRKEALMQQLEAETHAEEPCDPRKILEIERVIKLTDAEIDRRDREISDLRSLLEQQSFAHNGMAVGVAAVAEMIESDGLIVAGRLRLQELQHEWEQKQRQAEIEMSLERAKLARERLELQERHNNFENTNPPQTEEEKKSVKERGRGKWLALLGLRDE